MIPLAAILHKSYEAENSVIMELPVSRWDMLDAKARLGVKSLNDCLYEFEPPSDLPQVARILKNMPRGDNFFNELNDLGYRIKEMSDDDRVLFNGALAIYGPNDMQSIINLTYHNLDGIVVAEASTDHELGQFLVDNNMVEFQEDVLPYLDFSKVGAEYRAEHTCCFDGNLFYEDLNSEISAIYDGCPLVTEDHVFQVTMRNKSHVEGIELKLPISSETLQTVKMVLELDSIEDAEIISVTSKIDRLRGIEAGTNELHDLNNLAIRIHDMKDAEYIKFMAVLEHQQVIGSDDVIVVYPSLEDALYFSSRLRDYNFIPGVQPEDIGSY